MKSTGISQRILTPITNYKLPIMSTGLTMTVSDEKAVMSGFLHSEMLNTLLLGISLTLDFTPKYYLLHLTGIYTPLYFGTMYISSGTIISCLTALFKQYLLSRQ